MLGISQRGKVVSSQPESEVSAEMLEATTGETGELNQTLFAEDVLFTDLDARRAVEPVQQAGSRSRLLLLMGLGFFAALVFGASIWIQMSRQQTVQELRDGEQTAVQQQQGVPGLERQLTILRNDIELSDPLESPLAFPPVNFTLALEDATLIQLEQQQRQR